MNESRKPAAKPRRQEKELRIARPVEIPELYQVLVECRDVAEQEAIFDRMTAEGRKCRVLTL